MDNNSDTVKGNPSKKIKVELPENVTIERKNVYQEFMDLPASSVTPFSLENGFWIDT